MVVTAPLVTDPVAPSSSRLRVRVRRVEGAPVAALRVWIRSGARVEKIPGQSLITGRMLSEGTRRRDWKAIAEEAEARGMLLSSFGTFEYYGVAIDSLTAHWELALDRAAELVRESAFPADRCTWLTRQTHAELESLADQPEIKTAWKFLEQLYDPHPRCRPLQGSRESLLRITPDDCAEFHRRSLANGLLVTASGLFDDEDLVERRIRETFGGLDAAAEPLPEPPQPAGNGTERQEIAIGSEDQAHLYLGHLTVRRHDPDYTALEVLSVILGSGAGLTGRIPHRIREREGLAYSANAEAVAGAGTDRGRLIAYVGTALASVEKAERGVREEIARLASDGVEEAELEEARAYLLGREPFRRETARQWAEILAEAEHYQLPLDDPGKRQAELLALDRETIEAVARRHLRPEELRVTVGVPDA